MHQTITIAEAEAEVRAARATVCPAPDIATALRRAAHETRTRESERIDRIIVRRESLAALPTDALMRRAESHGIRVRDLLIGALAEHEVGTEMCGEIE